MYGDPSGVASWGAALAACILAPVAGFVLKRYGRLGLGLVIAILPIVGGLLLAGGIIPGV